MVRKSKISLLSFFWIGLLLVSCGGDDLPKQSSEHDEMVKFLAQQQAEINPEHNYHLTLALAEKLKKQIAEEQDVSQRFTMMVKYGKFLANGGKTGEAIAVFQNIITELGGVDKALEDQTLPIYKLLAVAYLRKGELDNCVVNHNDDSCIMPLSKKALHKDVTGSEGAVRILEKVISKYPDDLSALYLKEIAEMTLGGKNVLSNRLPNSVIPKWQNKATSLGVDQTGIAGGTIVDDFNNDGLLDIIASSYDYGDQLKYYENNVQGGFDDKTASANLMGITGGLNINHTDYNNDGNLDIFIMRGGWLDKGGLQPNSLLKGNGDGTFTDVTKSSGLFSLHPTQTSVWGDFNQDGHIDLFIGNEDGSIDYGGTGQKTASTISHVCEMYINNGDGTFTDKASDLGLNLKVFTKGVTAGDINNDGYPDLYISNINNINLLLINVTNREGKLAFATSSSKVDVGQPINSFPTWIWDYNNDGLEDIYVGAYDVSKLSKVGEEYYGELIGKDRKVLSPAFYKNNGDGTFTDIAEELDLGKSMFSMGCNFGDLDNDGYLDFYMGTGAPNLNSVVPNRMFLNRGSKFEEVTYNGFGHIQKGHGIGWGDMDNDGDQDIYAVMGGAFEGDVAQNVLYENPGTENNWLTVKLVGTKSNKAAIGARIQLKVLENGTVRKLYRTVTGGSSFGANSFQLEIGIGSADAIQSMSIKWPIANSSWITMTGLTPNTSVVVTEGDEQNFKMKTQKPIKLEGKSSGHSHHHH